MQMVHINVPTDLYKMQRRLDTEKKSLDSLTEEKKSQGQYVLQRFTRCESRTNHQPNACLAAQLATMPGNQLSFGDLVFF